MEAGEQAGPCYLRSPSALSPPAARSTAGSPRPAARAPGPGRASCGTGGSGSRSRGFCRHCRGGWEERSGIRAEGLVLCCWLPLPQQRLLCLSVLYLLHRCPWSRARLLTGPLTQAESGTVTCSLICASSLQEDLRPTTPLLCSCPQTSRDSEGPSDSHWPEQWECFRGPSLGQFAF